MQSVILQKQASDGLIIKEIKFDQVRTQTFIDGKPAFTETRDIKRLGYKSTGEFIEYLKSQGYQEQ